jgi:hypothetical protein
MEEPFRDASISSIHPTDVCSTAGGDGQVTSVLPDVGGAAVVVGLLGNLVENKKISLQTPRNNMKMHIGFGSMIITDSGVRRK